MLSFSTSLDSDPQSWVDVQTKLQAAKQCCDAHHSKLLAVIVTDELKDLPVDVATTLKTRFGLEERSLFTLLAINVDPNDPSIVQLANNELKSIGHTILENAWEVHQEHGQRIVLEASQRTQAHHRLSVLDNCKV